MKIITGDITNINTGIIMHQVNCMGVMGSGVAKAIKTKWPIVFAEYKIKCDSSLGSKELLGYFQTVEITNDLKIVNSFTQLNYGTDFKQTVEDLLITNIKELDNYAKTLGVNAYVPHFIGCGLGGGDWSIIEAALKETDIIVVKLDD